MEFAEQSGYEITLAEHQNWYPDLSFVNKNDQSIKFAVDIKTSYRLDKDSGLCNGFTLGSHGTYFRDRSSTKNIQFPYKDYLSHIVLGVLYTRISHDSLDETKIYKLSNLDSITSVIGGLTFFVQEKWRIASDRSGSGNTANIGSIKNILDIIQGKGKFAELGQNIFDEFWINQGRLSVPDKNNKRNYKTLTRVEEYLEFKRIQGARWKWLSCRQ